MCRWMSMKGFIIYFAYSLKMKHDGCKFQQWKKRKKHFKIVVYPIYVAYITYNLKSFCDVKTFVFVVSCHVHKQKFNKNNNV